MKGKIFRTAYWVTQSFRCYVDSAFSSGPEEKGNWCSIPCDVHRWCPLAPGGKSRCNALCCNGDPGISPPCTVGVMKYFPVRASECLMGGREREGEGELVGIKCIELTQKKNKKILPPFISRSFFFHPNYFPFIFTPHPSSHPTTLNTSLTLFTARTINSRKQMR